MSRVDSLLGLLPPSIADEPDARAFLDGILGPIAKMDAYLALRRDALPELLDPALVPDELVPHLAAIVGVGRDLPAANMATTAELRRLVTVAMALWKEKGTRESWRDVVAVLAGKRSLILDWFYLRAVTGTYGEIHVLPAPGTAPGGVYDYPERVTDLWYMDPDGLVNAAIVHRFLDVCRPYGERINVYVALLVDDAGAGFGLWDLAGTGTSAWDADAATLTIGDGEAAVMTVGGTEATWDAYHAFMRLAVTGTAEVRVLHEGPADAYVIVVDAAIGNVKVYREVSGVRALLAEILQSMVEGFPYRWSFEVEVGSTLTLLRVIFEASVLYEVEDVAADRLTFGPAGYAAQAGATIALSTALVYPFNVTPTRVGPDP